MLDLIGKVYNGATDVAGGSVGFISDTLRATREAASGDFGEAAEVLFGSVQEDLLGGVVGGLFGPEGIGGGIIGALPEGVRAGGRYIVNPVFGVWDWTIQELVDRPLGTMATVINAGIAGGPQNWFDPRMYARAWEINDKRTFGQSVTAALRLIDPFDEEEYNSIKDDPLFNLMSGTLDFFQEFIDPLAWTGAGAVKVARGGAVSSKFGRTFKTPDRFGGRLLPRTGEIVPTRVFPDSMSEARKLGLRPTTIAGRGRGKLGKFNFLVKNENQRIHRQGIMQQYVAARIDNGLQSAEWNKIEDTIQANPQWNANDRFGALREGLGARGRKLPVEVMRLVANGKTRTARERSFRLMGGDQSVWDDIAPEVEQIHEILTSPQGEKISRFVQMDNWEEGVWRPPGERLSPEELRTAELLKDLMEDTDWALFAAFEDHLIMSQRKSLYIDPERGNYRTDPNLARTLSGLDYKVQLAGLEVLLGQVGDEVAWANGVGFMGKGELNQLPMGTRTQALLAKHREGLKTKDTTYSQWRNPNTIGGENRVVRMITERISHTHIFFRNESAIVQFERMITAASRLNIAGQQWITKEQAGARIGEMQALLLQGNFAEAQELFNATVGSANKWIDEMVPTSTDGKTIDPNTRSMTDEYKTKEQEWIEEKDRVVSVGVNAVERQDRTGGGSLRFTKDENANTLLIYHSMSPSQIKDSAVIPRYDIIQRKIELAQKRHAKERGVKYGDLLREVAAQGQVILENPMAIWRASVLLTPKWPMRVGLDEQLRLMAHLGTLNSMANFNGAFTRMRRSFAVHPLKNFDEVADQWELAALMQRNLELEQGIDFSAPIDPYQGPIIPNVPVEIRIGTDVGSYVDDSLDELFGDEGIPNLGGFVENLEDLDAEDWEGILDELEAIEQEMINDATGQLELEFEEDKRLKKEEQRERIRQHLEARRQNNRAKNEVQLSYNEIIEQVELDRELRAGAQAAQVSAEATKKLPGQELDRAGAREAVRRAKQATSQVKLSAKEEAAAARARAKIQAQEMDVSAAKLTAEERRAHNLWEQRELERQGRKEQKEYWKNSKGHESILVRNTGKKPKPVRSSRNKWERPEIPLGTARVVELSTVNFSAMSDGVPIQGNRFKGDHKSRRKPASSEIQETPVGMPVVPPYVSVQESLPKAPGLLGEVIVNIDAPGSPFRNTHSPLGGKHPTSAARQEAWDIIDAILDWDEKGRLGGKVNFDEPLKMDPWAALGKPELPKIERGSDFLGEPIRPAAWGYASLPDLQTLIERLANEKKIADPEFNGLTATERRFLEDLKDSAAVQPDEVETLYLDWVLSSEDAAARQVRELLQKGELRSYSLASRGVDGPSHAHVLAELQQRMYNPEPLVVWVSGSDNMLNRAVIFDALDEQLGPYFQDYEVVVVTSGYVSTTGKKVKGTSSRYRHTEEYVEAWAKDRGVTHITHKWKKPLEKDYPTKQAHRRAYGIAAKRHNEMMSDISSFYIGFKMADWSPQGVELTPRFGGRKKSSFDWSWEQYHQYPASTGASRLYKIDYETGGDYTQDVYMRGPEARKQAEQDYSEATVKREEDAQRRASQVDDNEFGQYDSELDVAIQDEIAADIREEMPDLTPEEFAEEFQLQVARLKGEEEQPIDLSQYEVKQKAEDPDALSPEDEAELDALAQEMREERGAAADAESKEAKAEKEAKIAAEQKRRADEEIELAEAQAELAAERGELPIPKKEPAPKADYLEELSHEIIRTRPEMDYEKLWSLGGKEGLEKAADEIISKRVLVGRDLRRLRRNAGIKAIIGTGIVFGNPVMGAMWGYASYMSKQRKIRKAGQQRAAAAYSSALRQQGRELLKEATSAADRKTASALMSDADYIDSLIAGEVENAAKIKNAFTAADELMSEAGLPSLQIGNMSFRNAMGDDNRFAEQIRAEVSANSQMSAIYSGSYKSRRRNYEKYAGADWEVFDIEKLAIQKGRGAEVDTAKFAEAFDRMLNLYTTNTNVREFYEIVWGKGGAAERAEELGELLLQDFDLLKTLVHDGRDKSIWDDLGVEEVRQIARNIVNEYDNVLPPKYLPQTRARAQSGQVGWKDVERELSRLIEDDQILRGVEVTADQNKIIEAAKEIRNEYQNFGRSIGPKDTVPGDGRFDKLGKKASQLTEQLFVKYGSIPSDELARHPFFSAVYEREMRRKIEPLLDEDGMVSLSQDAINRMEAESRKTALRETKKVLYDLNEQSRIGELLGNASPFFNAWQEVASRWAGFAVDNPTFVGQVGRLYRREWEAEALGLTEFEDENGRKYIALRLFGDAFDEDGNSISIFDAMPESIKNTFMPPILRDSQATIRFSKDGINTMLQMSPGAGPLVTVPLREAVLVNPSLESTVAFMFPFGHPHADNFLERVLKMNAPTYLKAVDDLVRDTHTKEAVVARMFQDIMLEMQARGEPFDYSDEQMWNEVQLEAEHRANQFFMFRIGAGLFSPTSTTWQSPYLPYMEAYNELEQKYRGQDDSYTMAQTEFLDKYGEEFFLATGTFTKLNDGVPATLRAEQEYDKYQELMQGPGQHVGAWVSGSLGSTGERFAFSQVSYNRQLSTPISPGSDTMRRERKTGREMFADTQEQLGWREYNLARDIVKEYQDQAEQGGLSRSLNAKHLEPVAVWWQGELARIKAKYPDWAIQFEDIFASQQTMRDRLDGFIAGLKYEEIRNRPSSRHLLEYLNTRMVVQRQLQERYAAGGSRVLTAQDNIDLLTYWEDFKDHMESRPEFSRLFREYFLRDEIHFMTFIQEDEMPEGWFV